MNFKQKVHKLIESKATITKESGEKKVIGNYDVKSTEKDFDKRNDLGVVFDFPFSDWKKFGNDKRTLEYHADRYARLMIVDPKTLNEIPSKAKRRNEYIKDYKIAMQKGNSADLENFEDKNIRAKVIKNIRNKTEQIKRAAK